MASPLIFSHTISQKVGKKIFLKLETLHPSGSFKNRGIGNICRRFKEEGYASFVCSSGGNAGLAVAYSGRQLGVETTVVVPEGTLEMMLEKIRAEGARVIVHGKEWREADQKARELAAEKGSGYISPFDHPYIWEGHESLVEELVSQTEKPDALLLSVGGGGLFCGVVQGLRRCGWDGVPVVTAETAGTSSLAQSLAAGRLITLERIDSIAKSLCAPRVAEQAFAWAGTHPTLPAVVSDRQAAQACIAFAKDHRILVEPACGAALAVVYEQLELIGPFESLVVVVCGGCAVSCELLERWGRL